MGGQIVRKQKKPMSVQEYHQYLLSIGFTPEQAKTYTAVYEKNKPEWEEEPGALETYGVPLAGAAGAAAAGAVGTAAAKHGLSALGSLFSDSGSGGGAAAAGNAGANAAGASVAAPTGVAAARLGSSAGDAASLASGVSPWVAGGLGGLGAGYSAYQGYKALEEGDSLGAGLAGAGLGAGGALALNALGPSLFAINPLLGAGVMAAALLGGNELMGGWDKNRWQTEQNRWNDLVKTNPELSSFVNPDVMALTKGRSMTELKAIDDANIAAGKWANPAFTASRNEADLKPEDTWGYATWGEQYGPKYFTGMSEDQRKQLNQAALGQGLVNEHHGTIDVNYNALNDYLKQNNPDLASILGLS